MAGKKIIVFNRKASHEYFLEERFEAGLVLQGTEIKSIRQGHVQIRDAYISFTNDEAYVKEMHILGYAFGNRFNHDETRIRKLLLHKGRNTQAAAEGEAEGLHGHSDFGVFGKGDGEDGDCACQGKGSS